MKIAIALGTRPEIIKMAPIIRECEKRGLDFFVLHTGQHYDYTMDKIFFSELELEPRMINLNVKSGTHAETTAKIMLGAEKVLREENPDIVLVEGDTNTVLAVSLTSVKMQKDLGHVEAGLRSYDRRQPEEYNRIVADHVANYLFAPTKENKYTLISEGIPKEHIFTTGNTIVDSVQESIEIARKKSKIMETLALKRNKYFLVTSHREENVDYKERLKGILEGLKKISDYYFMPIIFPIHPRTMRRIKEFGLENLLSEIKKLKLIEPVGFFDFLMLESNASLVLTDSGGVVEETCILRTPCVSMRDKSDRPESIDVGASVLSGCDPDKIFKLTQKMLEVERKWKNPFGDGKAAKRIVDIIQNNY